MFTAGCNGSDPDMAKCYNIELLAGGKINHGQQIEYIGLRYPIICVLSETFNLLFLPLSRPRVSPIVESPVIPGCHESLRASRDPPPT